MDRSRVKEIRNLCQGATPGPWKLEKTKFCHGILSESPRKWIVDDCCIRDADAEFIIQARAIIPELLDEIERLYDGQGSRVVSVFRSRLASERVSVEVG